MFVNNMNMNVKVFDPHEKAVLLTLLTVEQSKLAKKGSPATVEEYEILKQKIANL